MSDSPPAARLFDEARAARRKAADLRARYILLVDVFDALSDSSNVTSRAPDAAMSSPKPGERPSIGKEAG
ncbi:hypothetical protein [Amycolatopsis sp. BJA-103]|uniref:hypothetical protein n=1 Tax=Amycolatopsis sp. BJA-103 TaxID=1911175 RepID=UPI000C76936C|nr:hypothetical protein [Amycolatopsis sp. BJA-103]AUI58998.1 hypothetical protein BKN51_12770 [Amycolatopsis sp. BJA-103]PNE17550.1 hypothetical protein B1H26_21775 [Amycolatopsis sp. BJA-103]